MPEYRVIAVASVSLEFRVKADDEETADEMAAAQADKIKNDFSGHPIIPPGLPVTVSWPSRDMWVWEPAEET
jgi:hypothetical protein